MFLSSVSKAIALVSKSPTLQLFRPASTGKDLFRQFYDDEANFGKSELRPKKRPGRSWTEDELRLKSNADLHKLW
ncbi:hypothetical protein TELCIR_20719 [Teladorsagia circumcincta]|uniref:Uncharacterized protein n=1 Tax=Teladorsagia circumcincta TaxID=45464 RepID=A0A2G9TIT3_TELCI|nr:hypothetical protein TELCIR_20719 [Teladorsagia circumcincta]